jgi:hypothetical protein
MFLAGSATTPKGQSFQRIISTRLLYVPAGEGMACLPLTLRPRPRLRPYSPPPSPEEKKKRTELCMCHNAVENCKRRVTIEERMNPNWNE